jgi:hypothetical protein
LLKDDHTSVELEDPCHWKLTIWAQNMELIKVEVQVYGVGSNCDKRS